MPQPLVVAALPFRFNVLSRIVIALTASVLLLQWLPSWSQSSLPSGGQTSQYSPIPNGYLARIQLDSPQEIEEALLRAEQLFLSGQVETGDNPLAFVLHGPEVAIFLRENYGRYKKIVDLAARLTAFEVVDVRVCETRMGILGREKSALVPFVGTVPFGPAEVDRLLNQEKYVYF